MSRAEGAILGASLGALAFFGIFYYNFIDTQLSSNGGWNDEHAWEKLRYVPDERKQLQFLILTVLGGGIGAGVGSIVKR